jgi:DNA-binding LacI/PurR family transcriptional regulator
MATSHDVARAAGVSQATVSRALSGSSEVSEETRARVQAVAARLGYRPNLVARSLVRGESRTIAVGEFGESDAGALTLSRFRSSSFHYYLTVLTGIEAEAAEHGYDIFTLPRRVRSADDFAQELKIRQVAGTIALPTVVHDLGAWQDALAAIAVPTVLLESPADGVRFPSVQTDNFRGMLQVTRYLLRLGHHRIACVGGSGIAPPNVERCRGWRVAHEEAGIPIDESLLRQTDFTIEAAYHSAVALIAERRDFTAIVAVSDMMAIGILRALAEFHLRVPHDVSVTGFDDIDLCQYTNPPLTTVRQDGYLFGRTAVRRLLALIHEDPYDENPTVLPAQLIIRGSSGPPSSG